MFLHYNERFLKAKCDPLNEPTSTLQHVPSAAVRVNIVQMKQKKKKQPLSSNQTELDRRHAEILFYFRDRTELMERITVTFNF